MSIPSHLSEHVFRWCEPFIARAVKAWPQETRFTPDEMRTLDGVKVSPNTFSARMRDAVTSLRRFKWDTTIDTVKLSAMVGHYVIAFASDGTVWWKAKGHKEAGRPTNVAVDAAGRPFPEFGTFEDKEQAPWRDVTEDEVRALALLLDKGRLSGSFTIDTVLPDETVSALENEFNVSVMVDLTKSRTIIT